MIADFYDSFGKDTDMDRDIPPEILELLNKDLPDNFMYVKDENGEYVAVPRPDNLSVGLKLTTQFDFDEKRDAELIEKLKIIPRDKWAEYFYRTQRRVPVKNLKIGNDKKVVPIEKTMGNPLKKGERKIADAMMFPESFPEPIEIHFESSNEDKVCIQIQQQAYDSLAEIKFSNVNFPALRMELYQYSPLIDDTSHEESVTSTENPIRLTYSVTPSKAQTVKDAIAALHIFKGLFDGTAKMNGQVVASKGELSTVSPKQIDDALEFWKSALQLEQILKVSFNPGADFPMEDVKFFSELCSCYIDKKEIVWKHPFNHFHIGGYKAANEDCEFENFIGKDNICYKFTEGPIESTLLGATFNIYSHTEMKGFVITNIEWDDKFRKSGEVYITDAPDKVWTLSRLYITDEQI